MGFSIEKQTESRVSQINFLRKNPVDLRKKLGGSEKMNTKRESNEVIAETLKVIEDTLNQVTEDLKAENSDAKWTREIKNHLCKV